MSLYSLRVEKDRLLGPIADAARRHGLTPNHITAMGLVAGLACGAMLAFHQVGAALLLGLLSAFCDVLDGTVARRHHLGSGLGLALDSVADRVCELAVVMGALAGGMIGTLGVFAIIGSVTLLAFRSLSHMRGQRTDYVSFGRFERLLLILVGLLSPLQGLSTLCFVMAGVFGLVSSLQIAHSLLRSNALRYRASVLGRCPDE